MEQFRKCCHVFSCDFALCKFKEIYNLSTIEASIGVVTVILLLSGEDNFAGNFVSDFLLIFFIFLLASDTNTGGCEKK